MLFAFEGPDEVGKTSLASALTERLRNHGYAAEYVALPGHVVGTLGQHVYDLHHNPAEFGIHEIDPVSVQLLHVASHVDQLNRVILPTLARGRVVILDRYWWSAPVYAEASGVDTEIVHTLVNLQRAVWAGAAARIVFLVHRTAPLTQSISVERFEQLAAIYDRFAAVERNEVVMPVRNDADLATALAAVERPAWHALQSDGVGSSARNDVKSS